MTPWAVLSHLWLHGLADEGLELALALSELERTLPERSVRALADLADDRRRLFVDNIPLVAGAYVVDLAPSPTRDRSFDPPSADLPSAPDDHLGRALLALDTLEGLGEAGGADRQHVIAGLAAWLPTMAWAARRQQPLAFHSCLVELTLDMVLSQLHAGADRPDWRPAGPADDGARTATALCNRLLSPAGAGIYLPRGELSRLAQWLGLPPPELERSQALAGLLRAAAARGVAERLLDGLDNLLVDAELDRAGLVGAYPAWAPVARVWSERVRDGRATVDTLRSAWQESLL